MTTTEPAAAHVTPPRDHLAGFLDGLAAPIPNPGGGAASAMALAMGVALAQMVAGYSPAATQEDPTLLERLAALREDALHLRDCDGEASADFAAAFAIPETDSERGARIIAASLAAAETAFGIANAANSLLVELRTLDRLGERRVQADVRVGAAMVGTAIRASVANVRACLDTATTAGATTHELVDAMRRRAALTDHLDLADQLAAR